MPAVCHRRWWVINTHDSTYKRLLRITLQLERLEDFSGAVLDHTRTLGLVFGIVYDGQHPVGFYV